METHSSTSAEWVLLFFLPFIWNVEVNYFYTNSKLTICSSTSSLKTKTSLGLRRNVWDLNLVCFKSQRLNQNLNCPYVSSEKKKLVRIISGTKQSIYQSTIKSCSYQQRKSQNTEAFPELTFPSLKATLQALCLSLCYIPRRVKYYLLLLWLGYRYIV